MHTSARPASAISVALARPCAAIGWNIRIGLPQASASSEVAPPALVTTTSLARVSAGMSSTQPSARSLPP